MKQNVNITHFPRFLLCGTIITLFTNVKIGFFFRRVRPDYMEEGYFSPPQPLNQISNSSSSHPNFQFSVSNFFSSLHSNFFFSCNKFVLLLHQICSSKIFLLYILSRIFLSTKDLGPRFNLADL